MSSVSESVFRSDCTGPAPTGPDWIREPRPVDPVRDSGPPVGGTLPQFVRERQVIDRE